MQQQWTTSSWLALALGLALFELLGLAPLVAIFFAAGAFVTAGAQLMQLVTAPWACALLFVVASASSLWLVRPKVLGWATRRGHDGPIDSIVGQPVLLLQALAPGQAGAGTLRGTRWQVRNVGNTPLERDARPPVVRLDGLTLLVSGPTPESTS